MRGGPSTGGTCLRPPTPLVLPPDITDRHIMTQIDFRGGQFTDDEGRDGP
jgi:hypothetical protein